MNRTTTAVLALFLCALSISCTEVAPSAADQSINAATDNSLLATPENRQAAAEALSDYFLGPDGTSAKGASFIAPFFTAEGWGILNFSGGALEAAGFTAELTDQDFYRENNDGTVSVHVNSNTAAAEYYENLFDPDALVLLGTPAHLSANYSGPVVEIVLPFGTIRFIDLDNAKSISVHGNGKVQDESGNEYKLAVKVAQTPSGNRSSGFTLK